MLWKSMREYLKKEKNKAIMGLMPSIRHFTEAKNGQGYYF
ncbi:hypothetical protein GCWU000325_01880 [Alloprevotella tannerae ATCC 51259]|uniref:Uncharacterized protein n=1 Tax=Alloprevotella tannerae ATCC 51259 TaxID=626522 RepID=C9LI24_9BACT|nr:hypothetical protein GCWU000325_01880 [Alloprevotella tannerae ATCC 51259]